MTKKSDDKNVDEKLIGNAQLKNDERTQLSEELLDKYLAGDSSVSDAYRELEPAEPPAALDRAILAEAREAARPRRKSLLDLDLAFWRQWAKPLTTAVIMGVCLTVVLRVLDYEAVLPITLIDAELALAEQNRSRLLKQEQLEAPATTGMASGSPNSSARFSRDSRQLAAKKMQTEPSAERPAGIGADSYTAERTQTPRRRAATFQDTPLAIAGLESEQIRKSRENATDIIRADDALEAWEQGARPAADVWLAGIEALYPDNQPSAPAGNEVSGAPFDEPDTATIELARMAQVYPAEARLLKERHGLMPDYAAEAEEKAVFYDLAAPESLATITEADAAPSIPDERMASKADRAVNPLADPYVWAAGINWLYENNRTAEAEAEQEKFRRIYPNFELN